MRGALAGFAVAAAYWPGLLSASSMPRWWALALALPLISDLDPRPLLRTPAGALLAAGVAWGAATLAWAPLPADGLLDWYFLALVALCAAAAAKEPGLAADALAGFCCGLAPSSLLAVLQMAGASPVDVPHAGPAGFFLNTEVFALAAAPALVWALAERRWALAAAPAVAVAVCGSRVALAMTALGLLAAWRPASSWARPAALACVALAGIFAVAAFGQGSSWHRLTLWTTAVLSVVPLGRGLGWWASAHPEGFVHSDVLQFAVELGVGAIPLAAAGALVALFGRGSAGERGAFAAFAVGSTFSFAAHGAAGALVGGVVAGALAVRGRALRRGELLGGAPAGEPVRRAPPDGGERDRGRDVGAGHVSARPQRAEDFFGACPARRGGG